MYSAREGGEDPFQHACLEMRSGRRLEKREVFVLWLEKIVVNTIQGQKKKKKGRKNICNPWFCLLSLTKLQMKCGSFYKFQEECCYYDPFSLTPYLEQACQTCSSRRARGSTHATSLLALCVLGVLWY